MLTIALLGLLTMWLLASPTVSPNIYRTLLFKPQKNRGNFQESLILNSINGAQEIFFFNRQGKQLRAFYFYVTDDSPVLFYCIGNDGDIEKRALLLKSFVDQQTNVFIFEYGGFGKSAGVATLDSVKNDTEDAFEFLLASFQLEPKDVILYGESLGAAIASSLCEKLQPAAIITKSTFSHLWRAVSETSFRLYPSWLYPQLDPESDLQRADVPVFVIHGALDRKLSFGHAVTIYNSIRAPKFLLILAESRHAFMTEGDHQKFAAVVQSFLRYSICRSRSEAAALVGDVDDELNNSSDVNAVILINYESQADEHCRQLCQAVDLYDLGT